MHVKYTISLDVHDTIFKPSDQKMLETCVSVTVGKICVTFCDKPLVASALTYAAYVHGKCLCGFEKNVVDIVAWTIIYCSTCR